ncbi:hypothetical protein Patl1_07783 [Pistacia atlantica]|nr:hypothetical protein Patl1_07783 [Pistacia atlantica]
MSFLKVPLFQQLLHKSAEEFGFYNNNRIILPCDESTFRGLIKPLSKRALLIDLCNTRFTISNND